MYPIGIIELYHGNMIHHVETFLLYPGVFHVLLGYMAGVGCECITLWRVYSSPFLPFGNPEGVEIAGRERSSFTRLETRTKESNIYASIREFDYSLVYIFICTLMNA